MSSSTTIMYFTPNLATAEPSYDDLKPTEDELRKLLASGHANGISVAQARSSDHGE